MVVFGSMVKRLNKIMDIKNQITDDLKRAMKVKDELSLSVLRMLSSAIKNKEIVLREKNAELKSEGIIDVVKSEIKKRKDSVSAYEAGGRSDLAEKEKNEIKILEKYLPEQLSDEEIEKTVKEIVASGNTDFGKVMGQAMGKLKGKADGSKVGEIVKKVLGK